jgi:hypothetical protein
MFGHLKASVDADAPVTRGRFLRRAGTLGLAVAGVGELIASPLASASVLSSSKPFSTMRFYDGTDVPDIVCNGGVATCNYAPGQCGTCPSGNRCYYCTATTCQAAGFGCYATEKTPFTICCDQ